MASASGPQQSAGSTAGVTRCPSSSDRAAQRPARQVRGRTGPAARRVREPGESGLAPTSRPAAARAVGHQYVGQPAGRSPRTTTRRWRAVSLAATCPAAAVARSRPDDEQHHVGDRSSRPGRGPSSGRSTTESRTAVRATEHRPLYGGGRSGHLGATSTEMPSIAGSAAVTCAVGASLSTYHAPAQIGGRLDTHREVEAAAERSASTSNAGAGGQQRARAHASVDAAPPRPPQAPDRSTADDGQPADQQVVGPAAGAMPAPAGAARRTLRPPRPVRDQHRGAAREAGPPPHRPGRRRPARPARWPGPPGRIDVLATCLHPRRRQLDQVSSRSASPVTSRGRSAQPPPRPADSAVRSGRSRACSRSVEAGGQRARRPRGGAPAYGRKPAGTRRPAGGRAGAVCGSDPGMGRTLGAVLCAEQGTTQMYPNGSTQTPGRARVVRTAAKLGTVAARPTPTLAAPDPDCGVLRPGQTIIASPAPSRSPGRSTPAC
jgi:hypothetical protein